MNPPHPDLLSAAALAHDPWIMALAIIAGTFVHEDLTTIATGILVSEGVVGVPVALPALYVGIVLGDLGLYGLGRLIALNRFARRFADRERFAAVKLWLDRRLVAGVFLVRFLPGLRLSAYTTYGFFAMPFRRFLLSVLLAASIWTTGLFYLCYVFGALTQRWLGLWQWPAVVIAVLVPLIVANRIGRGGFSPAHKSAPPSGGGEEAPLR